MRINTLYLIAVFQIAKKCGFYLIIFCKTLTVIFLLCNTILNNKKRKRKLILTFQNTGLGTCLVSICVPHVHNNVFGWSAFKCCKSFLLKVKRNLCNFFSSMLCVWLTLNLILIVELDFVEYFAAEFYEQCL